MRKSRFTEEQILQAIRQADSGTAVVDVYGKLGISGQTFSRWRRQYAGLEASEVRELKSLKEENRKLKRSPSCRTKRGTEHIVKPRSRRTWARRLRARYLPVSEGICFMPECSCPSSAPRS